MLSSTIAQHTLYVLSELRYTSYLFQISINSTYQSTIKHLSISNIGFYFKFLLILNRWPTYYWYCHNCACVYVTYSWSFI